MPDCTDILKIGEFIQTRPARNSDGELSIPSGEAARPTSVEGGQVLRRIGLGSRIGPIEDISIFHKEGTLSIDVKVPSTSDREIPVWVNACTDEIQNCRQIAATDTVILIDDQINEASASCSKRCHTDSQGRP